MAEQNSYERGFATGALTGKAVGQWRRNKNYGDAYAKDSWSGVADIAGRSGDLETANEAEKNATAQVTAGWEKAKRAQTVIANVATSLQSIPYEQRKARISQLAPQLVQQGIPQDAISGFDPTDDNIANARAVAGQYSQFTDIKGDPEKGFYGVLPDGSIKEIRAPQPKQKIKAVNLGDRTEYIDENTGAVVRTESRGAQPKIFAPGSGGGPGGGKLKPNYRWKADGSGGAEPIPGTKEADVRTERLHKADLLVNQLAATSGNVLNAIKTIESKTDWGETGLVGTIAGAIPGTAAHDVQAAIDTIEANIGFGALQEMRASSPTGGALGSVTEKELNLLTSTVTSLKKSQSKEQFLQNVARVKLQYRKTLQAIKAARDAEIDAADEAGVDDSGGGDTGDDAGSASTDDLLNSLDEQ